MKSNKERLAKWLKVSSVKYLGPQRFKALYDLFGDNIDDIFRMSEEELSDLKGIITPQVIKGIEEHKQENKDFLKLAEEMLNKAKAVGGQIILIGDSDYPNKLLNSSMAHPVIYCLGNVKKFLGEFKSIAIVGTRKPQKESEKFTFEIAKKLVQNNWVVVSGLAKGIDSIAHETALRESGGTIAILGNGPDVVYPNDSKKIYEKIKKNGLLLSEYPFGTRPQALNLRKRNKTTVGFSDAVLIVETKDDGGTMNAFKGAQEQHKKVFVYSKTGPSFSGNDKIKEKGGVQLGGIKDISLILDSK